MDKLQILKGAEFAAEAKRRGLTLDQAVDLVMAQMQGEVEGVRQIPNSQVEYGEFGNQDELQNFGGVDKDGRVKNGEEQLKEIEKAAGKKDPNVVSRTYFVKGDRTPKREEMFIPDGMPMPERFKEDAKNRDFGIFQEDRAAPAAQVMQQELDRLNEGIDKFGADAFPGAADVAGRLEDNIKGNRDAERALVRDMVRRDRDGLASSEIERRVQLQLNKEFYGTDSFGGTSRAMPVDAYAARQAQLQEEFGRIRQNRDQVEANNWRAQARANIIGQDFTIGGRGAAADQAIANIGQIAKIGPAKIAGDFQVSTNPRDLSSGTPTELPINIPEMYNAPVTDNRFAGPLQRQQQFIADYLPGYREQGAFGNFQGVVIGDQLAAARAAMEGIKVKGGNVDLGGIDIRKADDLQAAADAVVAQVQARGGKFYRKDDAGKNVFIENPGIADVLEKGRMNPREMGDVAKALFAIEAARRGGVNQAQKNFYDVGMGQVGSNVTFDADHPGLGPDGAQIDMVRGQKVEGKDVRAQLQALPGDRDRDGNMLPKDERLTGPDLDAARMPFQGAVKGEGAPRAQFVRGKDRGLNEQQLIAKYGEGNGRIAAQIIKRYEQQVGAKPDGFGAPLQRNEVPVEAPRMTDDMRNTLAELNSAGQPEQGPFRPLDAGLKAELDALSGGTYQHYERPAGPAMAPVRRERSMRERADYAVNKMKGYATSPRYSRGRKVAGAIAGTGAAIVGLDAMIGGEKEKRQMEAQYQ